MDDRPDVLARVDAMLSFVEGSAVRALVERHRGNAVSVEVHSIERWMLVDVYRGPNWEHRFRYLVTDPMRLPAISEVEYERRRVNGQGT